MRVTSFLVFIWFVIFVIGLSHSQRIINNKSPPGSASTRKTDKSLSEVKANNKVTNNNDNDNDDDDDDDDDDGQPPVDPKNPKSDKTTDNKTSSKGSKTKASNKQDKNNDAEQKKKPSGSKSKVNNDDNDNDDDDDDEEKSGKKSPKKPKPDKTTKNSKLNDKTTTTTTDDDSDDDDTTPSAPTETTTTTDNDSNEDEKNCTKPSINDFPPDLFTQTQRRFGAVLLHVAFAAYLFVAITFVCDDYFMSSLEIIGEKLNLDQDVAGATFMAAGSSAPEVFISLIGIIVGESNPGIGAIVGSAIFNILFVVGLCGLFVLGTAKLTIWPFFRDAIFYCAAILLLVLLIRDDKVYWYESFVLLAFYGLYIFFMMNNDRFKNLAYEKFKILQQETKNILPEGHSPAPHNKQFGFLSSRKSLSKSGSQSGYNKFNDEDEMYAWGGTLDNIVGQTDSNVSYQNTSGGGGSGATTSGGQNKQGVIDMHSYRNADAMTASNSRQIDFDTAALHIMLNRDYFRPKTRFKMAVRRVIDEMLWIKRNSSKKSPISNLNKSVKNTRFDLNPLNKQNYSLFLTNVPKLDEPGGKLNFVKWATFIPIRILFYFTMPDCRVEKYRKWFVLTFILSILWLAVLSYLIIWMITVIGFTLSIPDSLMAVTFIAAGTSIPDAYTSVIVVKEGMVDMGVSNIIGSNVFDLLIGLALPWFIKSIFNSGYVEINSNGLIYDSLLLYACVLATICVIHIRKWNLDRRTGYLFLSIYAAFIIFSSAIELNVFSIVNPPMCS